MATTVTDLKARKSSRDIASLPKDRQFPAMLESFKSEIQRALPRHLNPDRMARIALTEFRKNQRLAQCEPASVFAAIIQASQLGLEPGLMGQAYLIPYGNQCQIIPGYQGLVELVRRSGLVKRIEAHVVHDRDQFTYRTGLTTELVHEPYLDGNPGDMRLAYAVAEFSDGGHHVEVMTKAQINAIRDGSQNVKNARNQKKQTPWDTHTDEMWRKTVLRRICKYLPKSAELATALALDETAGSAAQSITVDDAIDGTWQPVDSEANNKNVIDTETGEVLSVQSQTRDPSPYAQQESTQDGGNTARRYTERPTAKQSATPEPPRQYTERPVTAPTRRDALSLVGKGDIDAALDIASGLSDDDMAAVESAIAQKNNSDFFME